MSEDKWMNGDDIAAQLKSVQARMRLRSDLAKPALLSAITKSCLLVERDAKIRMTDSPASGRDYWKGKHHDILHRASAPGEAPAVDTGTLRASVTHVVDEGKMEGLVGTHEDYGLYLEVGTSNIRPRPWLTPSLESNRSKIIEMCKSEVVAVIHRPEDGATKSPSGGEE